MAEAWPRARASSGRQSASASVIRFGLGAIAGAIVAIAVVLWYERDELSA